jgi:membrane-associated protease RseP (regulator of RpoE activity)
VTTPGITPDEAVSFDPSSELVEAQLVDEAPSPPPAPIRPRRIVLPVILFLLTCASAFFAGVTGWIPGNYLVLPAAIGNDAYFLLPARRAIIAHWQEGLAYMACVLAILLTHEMGHFVMTLVYRVRASLPYFLPLPISPIGTMGAVIGMDAQQANRKQIFDIGLAGPLAGLAVAIPIMWIGAKRLNIEPEAVGPAVNVPLAMQMAMDYWHPGQATTAGGVPLSQANPFFMAGWVGLIITGLNMLPVSQLDGGHVVYALFGRAARWIARAFMFLAFLYMGIMLAVFRTAPTFLLMAVLVLFLGIDHPPTRDDSVPIGWFRTVLGLASLAIPVFCFLPNLGF